MKKLSCSIGCILLIIFSCLLVYIILFYTSAGIIAEQLPFKWARDAAWEWILGDTKTVGHPHSDWIAAYAGHVIESGNFYWDPTEYHYSGQTSFICQVPVNNGYLFDMYGTDRGAGYSHTGIDYVSCKKKSDIVAVSGGIVTHAGWSYWLGWTVVVQYNDSDGKIWQTIYGHMCCGDKGIYSEPPSSYSSSIAVKRGDIIQAGKVLGKLGTTGNSSGDHIHWEVRECNSDGRCFDRDPNLVTLPGQDGECYWYTWHYTEDVCK